MFSHSLELFHFCFEVQVEPPTELCKKEKNTVLSNLGVCRECIVEMGMSYKFGIMQVVHTCRVMGKGNLASCEKYDTNYAQSEARLYVQIDT